MCGWKRETLWVSQAQMAERFEKDVRTINEHLRNIYKDGELDKEATIQKFQIVRQEGGGRQVNREIEHYNLDVAISIGCRVSSNKGTQFRMWVTQRLRVLLVNAYTANQQRFEQNAAELQQALTLIRKAAQSSRLGADEGRGLVEIIGRYTRHFCGCNAMTKGCWMILMGIPVAHCRRRMLLCEPWKS